MRATLLIAVAGVARALMAGRAIPGARRRARALPPVAVISAEAMVSLQKMTNGKEFEKTVAAYAKQKKLSVRDAELAYAGYLLDPDKFVLDAAAANKLGPGGERAAQRRPDASKVNVAQQGERRSPLLQAYIDEGGPEVKERIEKFERDNTIKACAIIACVFAFVITYDGPVP